MRSDNAAVADGVTEDRLLGGRVRLLQPRKGYRAATDPVLLAAAVPAMPGDRVLDLGCGAGAAALCLAARVPGLALTGLDIQPDYLALAEANAALNGAGMTLYAGDVAAMPAALRSEIFDHVFFNPPFHGPGTMGSPNPGRDGAHRLGAVGGGTSLAGWLVAALARTRPRGRITLIIRAEGLAEALTALSGPAGDIAVKPLAARAGRDAKRVIVSARKGAKGALRLLAPLVLHAGPSHARDAEDFTPEATAMLRDAAPLPL